MRQVVAFLKCINIRKVTEEYYTLSFHAKLHKAEIAPLSEILSVASEETPTPFDEKTDAEMDVIAKRLLETRKALAKQEADKKCQMT